MKFEVFFDKDRFMNDVVAEFNMTLDECKEKLNFVYNEDIGMIEVNEPCCSGVVFEVTDYLLYGR